MKFSEQKKSPVAIDCAERTVLLERLIFTLDFDIQSRRLCYVLREEISRICHLVAHLTNPLLPLDVPHYYPPQIFQARHVCTTTWVTSQTANIYYPYLFSFFYGCAVHSTDTLLLCLRGAPKVDVHLHLLASCPCTSPPRSTTRKRSPLTG